MPPDEPIGAGERTTAPHARILAVRGSSAAPRTDRLAGEEPLEIRVAGPGQVPAAVAVTMRTPGHEHELAAGFLVTEGLIIPADIVAFRPGDPAETSQPDDTITVQLRRTFDVTTIASRAFVASASCGICGKASIDDVVQRCDPLPAGPVIARSVLASLPSVMRDAQLVFDRTGGLHAAALFATDGSLVALREDIGRHNALDKVIGALALAGALPLHERALLVSGRVSFEIAQKAAIAGIPILAAISAPSDLAVATAERLGMTLIGFLRDDGFNIYAGAERLDLGA